MSTKQDHETGHVRDKRNGKWWWCHNAVIDQYGPTLGPHGLAVYAALCRYANDDGACWPSIAKIAHDTGMSTNRARRSLADLEASGLISIERRRAESDLNLTSVYTLREIECSTPPRGVLHHVEEGTSPRGGGVLHHVEEGTSPRGANKDSVKKTHSEKDPMKKGEEAVVTAPPPEPAPKPSPSKSKRQSVQEGPPKEPTPQQALVGMIAKASFLDLGMSRNRGRVVKAAGELGRVGATPEQVERYYVGPDSWWFTRCDHWAAQKHQRPTPEFICETWGWWNTDIPGNGHPRAAPMTRHERNLRVLEEHERKSNGNGGDVPPPPGTIDGKVIRYG